MSTHFRLNDQISIDQTKLIGKGSTGNVYLGFNNYNPAQNFAIKAIDLNQVNNEVTRYLLSCQIVALTNISKDNPQHIVKLKDVILSNNCCYLAMQLLQGGPLSEFIKSNPNGIQQRYAIQIFSQLIEGYKQIKRHGIVHRDIKPDNIIFRNQRNKQSLHIPTKNMEISSFQYLDVVLIDFGYCTVQKVPNKPQVYYNVGSPKYMSPQAYKNNSYSQKSDIWALGIILYQMVHGKTFDTGMQMNQYLNLIQTQGIPTKVNLSEDMRLLINGMLSYNHNNRFNSEEVSNIIQRIILKFTQKNNELKDVQRQNSPKRHLSQQKPFIQNSKRNFNLMHSMILSNQNQGFNQNQFPQNQNPLYRRDSKFVRVLDNFVNQNIQGRKMIHIQRDQNLQKLNQERTSLIKTGFQIQQEYFKNSQNGQNQIKQEKLSSNNEIQKLRFKNDTYKSQFGQNTQRKYNNCDQKKIFFNSQVTNFRPPSPFREETQQEHNLISKEINQKQNLFIPKQDKHLQKSFSTNNVEIIRGGQTNFAVKNKQLDLIINNPNQLILRNTMPHFVRQPQPQSQQNYTKMFNIQQNHPYSQNQLITRKIQNIPNNNIIQNNLSNNNRIQGPNNGFISRFEAPFNIRSPIDSKGQNFRINQARTGQQNQILFIQNSRIQKTINGNNFMPYNQENIFCQTRQKRASYHQLQGKNEQLSLQPLPLRTSNQQLSQRISFNVNFNPTNEQNNQIVINNPVILENKNQVTHNRNLSNVQEQIKNNINLNRQQVFQQFQKPPFQSFQQPTFQSFQQPPFQTFQQPPFQTIQQRQINNYVNKKMVEVNKNYFMQPNNQILQQKLNLNSFMTPQNNTQSNKYFLNRRTLINEVKPFNNCRQLVIIHQKHF